MAERKTEFKPEPIEKRLKRYLKDVLKIAAAIGLGYVALDLLIREFNAIFGPAAPRVP